MAVTAVRMLFGELKHMRANGATIANMTSKGLAMTVYAVGMTVNGDDAMKLQASNAPIILTQQLGGITRTTTG